MKKNKRKKKFTIIAILSLVVLVLFYPKIHPYVMDYIGMDHESEMEEIISGDAVILSPIELDNRVFSTGNISAISQVELRSEVSGKVIEVNIDEGRRVSEGELLVKINDQDLQARLQRAQFNLKLSKEMEERQRLLFERGGVSQQEYDVVVGELNSMEAEVALIEADIAKTEIIAPFSGTLGLRYITTGTYITPTTRIASLTDLSSIQVDFSIPERYASQVNPGDSVFFSVQGDEEEYVGRVSALEPQISTSTRTLTIRAVTPNPGSRLRPGSLANVELQLEQFPEAMVLPAIALLPDETGYRVMVYRDGKVESVIVQSGIRKKEVVQILDGLHFGDTIMVNGLMQLEDGSKVEIRNIINP